MHKHQADTLILATLNARIHALKYIVSFSFDVVILLLSIHIALNSSLLMQNALYSDSNPKLTILISSLNNRSSTSS